MAPCPICKKPAEPRPTNRFAPFCGVRCQQIDLGKWLSEDYRVPAEELQSNPDEEET